MTVQIRFASTEAEHAAIYRLRYRIYVEELGAVAFPGVNHEHRLLDEGGVRNSRLLRGARTAAVVAAADDVRVLYLRYREAETWLRDDPELAARLFLNLSRILAVKRVTLRH